MQAEFLDHSTVTEKRKLPFSSGFASATETEDASPKSNHKPPTEGYRLSRTRSPERAITELLNAWTDSLPGENVTESEFSSSIHLRIKPCASRDEVIFLLTARQFGIPIAKRLAAKFHWQCQRPLQALLAMMNERGSFVSKHEKEKSLLRSEGLLWLLKPR